MELTTKCPLKIGVSWRIFKDGKLVLFRMDSRTLKEIETHLITDSTCCPHTSLKEIKLSRFGMNEETTPLLLACQQGELDSVKHIVESWGVDFQATATYHQLNRFLLPHGLQHLQATPLFVAAIHGHVSIVRYLVGKGADLTAKTTSLDVVDPLANLTPLDGAFNKLTFSEGMHRQISIIRFLLQSGSGLPSHPVWKLDACYYVLKDLIDHGMDVNSKLPDGTSILHHWVGLLPNLPAIRLADPTFDVLTVVQLLVNKGADLLARDGCGRTPLKVVADRWYDMPTFNFDVFEFLLERDEIDRMEKIEALELVGADILGERNANCWNWRNDPLYSRNKAFEYWRRALYLRQLKSEECKPLIKIPLKRKSGWTIEWVTSSELENVISNPSKHKIQAFLIQLRIGHAAKSVSFMGSYTRWCFYERKLELDDLFDAMTAAFETIRDDPIWLSWHEEVVAKFSYLVPRLEKVAPHLFTLETIKMYFELMLKVMGRYSEDFEVDLMKMMVGRPEMLRDRFVMDSFSQLMLRKNSRWFHQVIVERNNFDFKEVDLLALICLLLQARVDPNTVDFDGRTPMHLLAQYVSKEEFHSIGRVFWLYGARLDIRDSSGKTAIDVWVDKHLKNRILDNDQATAPDPSELPDWSLPVQSLLSLSARAVCSNHIDYFEEVPTTLYPVLGLH